MGWLYGLAGIVLLFGLVVFRGAPYVPSHRRFAKQAFEKLYKLTAKDTLVDIGSGDGVVLRLAADKGAKAVGYEINPVLVAISRILSHGNPLVSVKMADYWMTEWPDSTTIVYLFGVSRDMEKTSRKLQDFADEVGRDIRLITYGPEISSKKPDAVLGAHCLYVFHPLQRRKT